MPKKNPSMMTLYARDVKVWERARATAKRRDISFSQYVEKLLREAETRLSDGEYSNLRTSA